MKCISTFHFKVISVLSVFCFISLYGCSSNDSNPTQSSNNNNPPPTNLTLDSLTDIDGNVYTTVKIGNQWWMAENLRVTRYRNGDPIEHITLDSGWLWGNIGGYCNVENNPSNMNTFGYIYNGFAVEDARNIAPVGWHIPTDAEWAELETFLGADSAGGHTKTTGTSLWVTPNLGATNRSGFAATPAGVRTPAGPFTNKGEIAFFWTSTVALPGSVQLNWIRGMGYAELTLRHQQMPLQTGMSVRCVKD